MAYEMGNDVDKNAGQAVKWYKMAADGGDVKAELHLGFIYRDGLAELQHDYAESLKWFHKAADQANPDAEFAIGKMYEQGMGVPASQENAIKWYLLASNHGQVQARAVLANLGVSLAVSPK